VNAAKACRRRDGRHLRAVEAERFLALLPPEIAGTMDELGFELMPTTRPFLSGGGHVMVRLVWRRRSTGACNVLSWWITGALAEKLMDALDEAMRPEMDAPAHA
jgi:hypothetical protein